MANIENLQPFTKENAKYYGKKGGIRSGKVRAERKSIKEQMKVLLNMPVSENNKLKRLKEAGFKETEINNQLLLVYSIFEKALSGDMRACELILNIINLEKENESQELSKVDELLFRIKEYACN